MDKGYCLHSVPAFLQRLARTPLLELVALHVQEARNKLEVVLDAMVYLLKQNLSFLEPPRELRRPLAHALLEAFVRSSQCVPRLPDFRDVDARADVANERSVRIVTRYAGVKDPLVLPVGAPEPV